MTGRLRHRAHDDEGVTLALTLVVMLLFALSLAFTLNFALASMKESSSVASQRTALYSVDSAIDTEISTAMESFAASVNAGTTASWPCPTLATNSFNKTDVAVSCSKSGMAIDGDNNPRPAYSITVLGPGGLTINGKGTVQIGAGGSGSILTRGPISVRDKKGILSTTGAVQSATNPCNKKSKGQINPACNYTAAVPADPAYAPAVTASSLSDLSASVPTTCPPAVSGTQISVVTFSPGRYSNAAAFNALMKSCKASKPKQKRGTPPSATIWSFTPGAYYFDFAKPDELKIDDPTLYLIGGTPKGWSATAPVIPNVPGACDRTAAGTQFVFGNSARLNMGAGYLEICPPISNELGQPGQSIAIYGSPDGSYGYARQSGPMLRTGDKATVSIAGTVYAPNADPDLKTKKITTPVVTRGIIVHSLKLGAGNFDGLTSAMPPDAAHAIHEVTMTLAGCEAKTDPSTCTTDNARVVSTVVLRYRVADNWKSVNVVNWRYYR